MKINGSLVFDASSASQIENLRLEKFSSLPAAPVTGDNGRLIYLTSTGIIYVAVNGTWVPLATGGNAAALLAEVDAIESSLGPLLNTDGSYNASALSGNLAGSTSVTNLFQTLQTLIANAVAATTAEATTRAAADTTLQSNIDAEATTARAAEGTLTTNLAAEVTRATNAEGVLNTAISSEVTRATAAEGTLTTNLAAETARAELAENTDAANLATEIAARIAADAVVQQSVTAETTRATGIEAGLRTDIDAEVARATTADTTQQNALTAEVTRATGAEGTLSTNLAAEVSRATARENALEADYNAKIQGLAWKNPVIAATIGNVDLTSAASGYDGVTLTAGDRVLVHAQTNPAENGIYVFSAVGAPLTRATDMDAASEFANATVYVRDGTTQSDLGFTQVNDVSTIGTDPVNFVQFNGAGSVSAGAGLTQQGNVINVVAADSSITVTADAIQVSAALQTAISNNTAAIATEQSRATAAEGVNAAAIAQETADRIAAVNAEHNQGVAYTDAETTRAEAAEAALDGRITTEVSRATAAEGTIATNLATEISDRGTAVAASNAAIAAEVTRATGAEGTLTTNLGNEVTRATAAETALDGRLTTAEGKLSHLYYLYTSADATHASHTVTHSLGQKYCNVTVVDSSDEVVIPQSITFTDANSLVVVFNTAIACKVVVMGLA